MDTKLSRRKKLKNSKISEKIVGFILDFFLVVVFILIIIGSYYIFQIKIMNKGYADIFGYTFFEVATGSMSPTIEIGDVVIVKITKQVDIDDIIVYQDESSFITHRLVEIDGDKMIAKGDANNSEDKPIQSNMILGQVIKIIPKVGIWRKVILTPEIIGLILVLVTIFGIAFVYTSKSEEKDDK